MATALEAWQRHLKREKQRERETKGKLSSLHQNYRGKEIHQTDLQLKTIKQEERRKLQETEEMWRQFKKREMSTDEILLSNLKQEDRKHLLETKRLNRAHQNNTLKESDLKLSQMRQDDRKRMAEHEAILHRYNHTPGFEPPQTLKRSSSDRGLKNRTADKARDPSDFDGSKCREQTEARTNSPTSTQILSSYRRSSIGTVVSTEWKATPHKTVSHLEPASDTTADPGHSKDTSIKHRRSVFGRRSLVKRKEKKQFNSNSSGEALQQPEDSPHVAEKVDNKCTLSPVQQARRVFEKATTAEEKQKPIYARRASTGSPAVCSVVESARGVFEKGNATPTPAAFSFPRRNSTGCRNPTATPAPQISRVAIAGSKPTTRIEQASASSVITTSHDMETQKDSAMEESDRVLSEKPADERLMATPENLFTKNLSADPIIGKSKEASSTPKNAADESIMIDHGEDESTSVKPNDPASCEVCRSTDDGKEIADDDSTNAGTDVCTDVNCERLCGPGEVIATQVDTSTDRKCTEGVDSTEHEKSRSQADNGMSMEETLLASNSTPEEDETKEGAAKDDTKSIESFGIVDETEQETVPVGGVVDAHSSEDPETVQREDGVARPDASKSEEDPELAIPAPSNDESDSERGTQAVEDQLKGEETDHNPAAAQRASKSDMEHESSGGKTSFHSENEKAGNSPARSQSLETITTVEELADSESHSASLQPECTSCDSGICGYSESTDNRERMNLEESDKLDNGPNEVNCVGNGENASKKLYEDKDHDRIPLISSASRDVNEDTASAEGQEERVGKNHSVSGQKEEEDDDDAVGKTRAAKKEARRKKREKKEADRRERLEAAMREQAERRERHRRALIRKKLREELPPVESIPRAGESKDEAPALPEEEEGDELLASNTSSVLRLEVLFSFGLLTPSDNPDFSNYLNAVATIVKQTCERTPNLVDHVWYDPVHPPFVQQYKNDDSFSHPTRSDVKRLLVVSAVPVFLTNGISVREARRCVCQGFQEAMVSGEFIRLVKEGKPCTVK